MLQRHGISVPLGALWPDVPDVGSGSLVVKAQTREGGRGKRGGIRFVEGPAQVAAIAAALLEARLGDNRVEQVYVEERLAVARELYLAIILDRDRRGATLLASATGGVDIEQVPPADLVRLPIDRLIGPRASALGYVLQVMGVAGEIAEQVRATMCRLYDAYLEEDSELLEINPLVVTTSGTVVAADARVVVDDRARFRHPDWPAGRADGTPFERAVRRLGAVGVELEPAGDVVVIASGAGLMMATLDRLTASEVQLRAAIDLGGTVFGESQIIGEIVREAERLHPRLIFVNAFFQLASCHRLAEGIRAALDLESSGAGVAVRLAGRDAAEAAQTLRLRPILEDFEEAIGAVVGVIAGQPV